MKNKQLSQKEKKQEANIVKKSQRKKKLTSEEYHKGKMYYQDETRIMMENQREIHNYV